MKIKDAYISFIDLVNKNLTNNNLNVDKPRFILFFNKALIEYTSWILEKRNEDVIRTISPLLILEAPLTQDVVKDTHTLFNLPTNYFELSNLHVFAKKGKCSNQKVLAFEVKGEDLEELLDDDSNKPSFEDRETFYLTTSNKVGVYKSDFEIEKVNLSYYRYPKQVDIAGYIRSDGSTSTVDIDPEFDDKVVHKILTAMAKQFSATNGDAQAYQMHKDKLFSEI
jgi:hypothetical protein